MNPMKNTLAAGLLALGLAGCTAQQVQTAISEGQLICAVGPTAVSMSSTTGAAIMAKNATKKDVDATCKLIGGIAVSPPVAGGVQSVTVALPASISIPLKS